LEWLSKNALEEVQLFINTLKKNPKKEMLILVRTIQACLQSGNQELKKYGKKI